LKEKKKKKDDIQSERKHIMHFQSYLKIDVKNQLQIYLVP